MINKPDFDRASKDGPISATVYYSGREEPVTYKVHDFNKIRFPARRITLNYEPGTRGAVHLGRGDYASRDHKKVRPPF